MRKYVLMVGSLLLATGFLGACGHTVEGAGRDIQSAGEWIQEVF